MEYFLQIYGTLPRAGPGSDELTRRAFALMKDAPDSPRILDIGCGPGAQTLELLRITSGTVVALDLFESMLARLEGAAADAGLSGRLETLQLDMKKMDFPAASFDVIWSEGAIYFLGFASGLRKIRKFLKPGGYVAVSEAVWLRPDPPAPVQDLWQGYPEIDTVPNKLAVIERLGYRNVGHFILPATAWTQPYYDPMEERIEEKAAEWRDIPEALAVLEEARHETATFREYSDYFSYAFFIMRK